MTASPVASIRERLARGVAWLGLARVLVNAMQAASMLVLTRLLLPGDIGVVVIALTALGLLTSLTDIPLAAALVRHAAPTQRHFHTAWTISVLRGVAVTLAFAAAAYPTALIYRDPRLVPLMVVLGFGALVSGLENPRAIMLTRQLVFWQQFLLQTAGKAVSATVSIALAFAWQSYWAIVIGSLAGSLVTLALSFTILPFARGSRWSTGASCCPFRSG